MLEQQFASISESRPGVCTGMCLSPCEHGRAPTLLDVRYFFANGNLRPRLIRIEGGH